MSCFYHFEQQNEVFDLFKIMYDFIKFFTLIQVLKSYVEISRISTP